MQTSYRGFTIETLQDFSVSRFFARAQITYPQISEMEHETIEITDTQQFDDPESADALARVKAIDWIDQHMIR